MIAGERLAEAYATMREACDLHSAGHVKRAVTAYEASQLRYRSRRRSRRLVCSRLEEVEYRDVRTEGPEVKGHWECRYHFSKTGRWVHSVIDV